MKNPKQLTRSYLQRTAYNVFTFGYGMPKNAPDHFGTIGGTEYFITKDGNVFKKNQDDHNKFTFILSNFKFS